MRISAVFRASNCSSFALAEGETPYYGDLASCLTVEASDTLKLLGDFECLDKPVYDEMLIEKPAVIFENGIIYNGSWNEAG